MDYDHNGWSDLIVGNGHIWDDIHLIDATRTYAQSVQIFANCGGKSVVQVLTKASIGSWTDSR